MVTIKEIAKKAGVSRGTVDRVINNRGSVKSETKEKILKILEKENYKPNIFGKMLANNKYSKKMIGVILNSKGNPFYDQVINGIENKKEVLENFGFELLYELKKGYDVKDQIDAIDKMILNEVQGLIITPIDDKKVINRLQEISKKSIPVVNLNIDIDNADKLAYIGSDYKKTGNVAGALFNIFSIKKIYKLLVVTGSKLVSGHRERINGLKEYLEKNDNGIQIIDIIENEDNDDKSYKMINQYIQKNKDFDGVFFSAGGIEGGIKALEKNHMLEKINIITVDLIPIVEEYIKKDKISATICQEPFKQGQLAVEVLLEYLLMNKVPINKRITMATEIKIKENL